MNIISRYIFREIVANFVLALSAFTGILLTIRLLKLTELIVNKGVQPAQVAMVLMAIIPTFLEVALPMASLLGVMLAFARLSGDSEIIVMRASGISLMQLLRPVAFFGVLAALLGLLVTLSLRPWGYDHLARSIFEIARSKSTAGLSPGTFNQLGALNLYAESINYNSGKLVSVMIDDKRSDDNRRIVFAKHGVVISEPVTQNIIFDLYDGVIHEDVGGKYLITHFSNNRLTISADEIYDPEAARKERSVRQLTQSEIATALQEVTDILAQHDKEDTHGVMNNAPSLGGGEVTYNELRGRYTDLILERGQRFSLPFAIFALSLLAMPLGVQPPRTQKAWGAGFSAILALFVFLIYYVLLSLGLTLAEQGKIAPPIALWVPNLIIFGIAMVAVRNTGSEKWQSISHGFEIAVASMKKALRWTGI